MRRFVLLAVVVLAACGTTVSPRAQSSFGSQGGLSPVTGPSSEPASSSSGPGSSGSASSASSSVSGSSGSSGSADVSLAPSGGSGTAAPGRPVTGPIQIGFINQTFSNAGNFGINTPSGHATQDTYQAIVTAINAHGGLDGRKVIPVYANVSLTGNWTTDYQAACATFTQDHHVAAVAGYSLLELESFEACLTKAGVVHLNAGSPNGDDQELAANPYLFMTAYPTADGVYLTELSGAVDTGLLAPGTKLGVMRTDCGWDQRAWSRTAEPFITQHRVTVAKTAVLRCPSNATDVATTEQSEIQSAVLQFHSAGVTVVMANGTAQYFADTANSQSYFPQYVITTVDTSEGLQTQNVPQSEMKNMHGFGWYPILDADAAHQPPSPPAQQAVVARCLALLHSVGYVPTQADMQGVLTTCDTLFLYERALGLTRGNSAPGAVAAAIESLGST